MEKKYYAFISYQREDESWAQWLQHQLEHYRLPSNLNGRTDLPKEIRPVFKDTSELNPGNLPQQIHDALEQSQYLIVICSPRSAKSEWVNREAETFIEMGRTDRIIPFIIDGKAFAKNPDEECFPKAIRELPEEQEILGANISEMGRDAASVKVVAQMFGLRFDELWQRYEREQRKKRNRTILGISLLALAAIGVAAWIWRQNVQLKEKDWAMMEGQSRFVSEKANDLTDMGQSDQAQRILIEMFPNDLEKPDRPYTPEAERALRNAYAHNVVVINGDFSDANYSPDGKNIIAVTQDSICLLDAEQGTLIRVLGCYEGAWSAAFSPDGEKVVVGANDFEAEAYYMMVMDADSGKELLRIEGNDEEMASSCFSRDGSHILSLTSDAVRVWDAANGTELFAIKMEESFDFYSTCYTPDNEQIVVVTYDSILRFYDANDGKVLDSKRMDDVRSVDFSDDGTQLACAFANNHDISITMDESGYSRIFHGPSDDEYYVGNAIVRLSPDKKHFITIPADDYVGLQSGPMKIWNADPVDELHETDDGEDTDFEYNNISYSPDGQRYVSTTEDGTLEVKDAASGKVLLTTSIVDEEGYYNTFATFSPDGQQILCFASETEYAAALPTSLSILDATTGEVIHELVGHSDRVTSASFSQDGKRIITSSIDGTIRVWDAEIGEEIYFLDGYEAWNDFITNATFCPDDQHITATFEDGTLRSWRFQPLPELIELTRQRFKDQPLSPEERHQYYWE